MGGVGGESKRLLCLLAVTDSLNSSKSCRIKSRSVVSLPRVTEAEGPAGGESGDMEAVIHMAVME